MKKVELNNKDRTISCLPISTVMTVVTRGSAGCPHLPCRAGGKALPNQPIVVTEALR